ncbi:MAG: hypothetical protein O7D91_17765 [Planctomycetota bacterium]|nr:hypothetical protein [Planctomycetota bacterium]
MAITADRALPFLQSLNGGLVVEFEVGATEEIFRGAVVCEDAGFASGFGTSQDFMGISLERVTGGASDGDNRVKVQIGGYALITLASVALANFGAGVYATDNQTFTLATTSSIAIGRIVHVPVTGTCWVKLRTPGEGVVQANAFGVPA